MAPLSVAALCQQEQFHAVEQEQVHAAVGSVVP